MKEIILTQGKVVQVDDEDFEYLNQFKWHAIKCHKTFYAAKYFNSNKNCRKTFMHRLIMNIPQGLENDHIDHDGLNNQKNNLRICTKDQNNRNRTPKGMSKYLGVYFDFYKNKKYINASIRTNGKKIYLGRFKTEEDAAKKYDKAALYFHGEFANLNFK